MAKPDFLELEDWVYTNALGVWKVGHYLSVGAAYSLYLVAWKEAGSPAIE